ncbi:hypothetical protein ASD83_15555 [Devosia sp. Root685]|uniref:hypothetical protein n=1 Tax=Devosia sp. Root685 TaxID=1736587 RepID=UPI0006F614F4|nr:hypothetical protein [Devosia sp. Root685]KRA96520.1 hypothetical protein ASD83_15555 [Devosia sp. Root685]
MADGLFGTSTPRPQLQQTALRPAGIPGSTFIRPQQRETGGNLRALAEALGGLNQSLQNYASVQHQEQEDPQSKAHREWLGRAQQMDATQLSALAASGEADGIRVREDAMFALLGERANSDFRTEWMTYYNTEFDRANGDAHSAYSQMRERYASGLESDIAKGNFYRLTGDHFQSWMEKDAELAINEVKTEISTAVVGSFRTTIDDAMDIHGKTPQEAAQLVFAQSAANRSFLEMTGQEQNDTLFAIANEYALKGEEGIARAIMEGQRTTSDGAKLPSLISIPAYTDKGLRMLEAAGATRDRKTIETDLHGRIEIDTLKAAGAFTQADADKMLADPNNPYDADVLAGWVRESAANLQQIRNRAATEEQKRELRRLSEGAEAQVVGQAFAAMTNMGGINRIVDVEIPNVEGTGTRTLTKDQIVGTVTAHFEKSLQEQQASLEANGVPEEEAARQVNATRLEWYAGNRIENDVWVNTLNGIAGRATVETIMQGGNTLAALTENAELYRTLKAQNSPYTATLLSDPNSKRFLEIYDNAVTVRRFGPQEALNLAAQTLAMPIMEQVKSLVSENDATRLAETILRDQGADANALNLTYLKERIHGLSMGGAMDIRQIDQMLRAEVKDNFLTINGMLLMDHRDLPDDFPALAKRELQEVIDVFGDRNGGRGVEDLYLVPASGGSKWAVWSKYLGGPISSTIITPQSLQRQRGVITREAEQRTTELLELKGQERTQYLAQYKAQLAEERAYINQIQSQNGQASNRYAAQMEDELDARLASEVKLWGLTPEEAAALLN